MKIFQLLLGLGKSKRVNSTPLRSRCFLQRLPNQRTPTQSEACLFFCNSAGGGINGKAKRINSTPLRSKCFLKRLLNQRTPTQSEACLFFCNSAGGGINMEISPHPRFSSFQVNGYTFENKKIICGTTSVPIESLHKASETPPRGLRGQA